MATIKIVVKSSNIHLTILQLLLQKEKTDLFGILEVRYPTGSQVPTLPEWDLIHFVWTGNFTALNHMCNMIKYISTWPLRGIGNRDFVALLSLKIFEKNFYCIAEENESKIVEFEKCPGEFLNLFSS